MTSADRLFNRIMVPVDGSRSAEQAARFALRLAVQEGCELVVLHVVDEESAADLARFADRPLEDIVERMKSNGEEHIAGIQKEARAEGVKTRGQVRVGVPHRVILTAARDEQVDLVVMGKVGRKGPRRVMIGSVTERVLEYIHVPVLVVK
jgi:nucleotide-binding universal stress UspA family protein